MATQQITTVVNSVDLTVSPSLLIVTSTGAVLDAIKLTSSGNIVSINGYAGSVYTQAFDTSVDNTIMVGTSGLLTSINVDGVGNTIINAGSIMTADNGSFNHGYSAIEIGGGGTSTHDTNRITNTGSIFATNPDYFVSEPFPLESYWLYSYGVEVDNSSVTILNNSGTISSTYGRAIKLGSASDTFTNTGAIFGSVDLGEGNNVTNNKGTIHGDFIVGAGNDVTNNSGAIYGDVLLGGGNNTLRSQTGDIFGTISTGNGNNTIFGPANGGVIVTGSGIDNVRGGEADDSISTGDGADKLRGMGDNDVLNGGAGADVMIGGAGDDTYYTDSEDDVLNEVSDGGSGDDTVIVLYATDFNLSTQSQLRGEFENLVLTGATGLENLNAIGTAADNNITGNGGANQISGLDGNDLLSGGAGADILIGGSGKDTLVGGSGADLLQGGTGNDVYRVDGTSDTVDETGGSGIDTVVVVSPTINYSLSDAVHIKGLVENLQLLAVYPSTTTTMATGNALNNTMTGNSGNNRFFGLDGNDVLNGMDGNDVLNGADGNDVLNGGDGNDVMIGGLGTDQFVGGNGSDTADFSGSATNLTVALDGSVANTGEATGDTFSSVEFLIGTNAAAGDTLIGDAAANSITGNAGNDSINGGAGSDELVGGLGSDTMTGGLGDDRFLYNTLADVGDTITDFSAVTGNNDLFRFNRNVFKGDGVAMTTGPVPIPYFITRATDHQAQDGNDFFIYQTNTHELWYDPTGSDVAGDAVRVATLQAGATVTRLDIWLV